MNFKITNGSKNTMSIRHLISILALPCLLIVIIAPQTASTHTYAASSFEARTNGREIGLSFRVNAASIVELVQRAKPKITDLKKTDIAPYQKLTEKYFKSHFRVTNNGKRCKAGHFTRFEFAKVIDKVVIDFNVKCKQDLNDVEISSKLFIEEETAHQIICTFFHKRAKQRYFLAIKSSALIHVNKLRQAPKRPSTSFRIVPPPKDTSNKTADESKNQSFASTDGDSTPTTKAKEMGSGFIIFVGQGIIHILGGLDHVLFVISLLIAVLGWRQLALVITSFTIAHTITLVLGSLDLVRASPNIVEPLIAASIIYVAVENIVRKQPKARAGITFGFGLVHGLGFSAVLQDIGLPPMELAPALLGFNVGVELGQLMIVAPLFPLLLLLRKKEELYKKVRIIACIIVTLVATFWFVERVIGAITS